MFPWQVCGILPYIFQQFVSILQSGLGLFQYYYTTIWALTTGISGKSQGYSKVLFFPEKIGKFDFEEFEIHAEVTAEGTIAILGTDGKIGAAGELRFVFRRSSASEGGKS